MHASWPRFPPRLMSCLVSTHLRPRLLTMTRSAMQFPGRCCSRERARRRQVERVEVDVWKWTVETHALVGQRQRQADGDVGLNDAELTRGNGDTRLAPTIDREQG